MSYTFNIDRRVYISYKGIIKMCEENNFSISKTRVTDKETKQWKKIDLNKALLTIRVRSRTFKERTEEMQSRIVKMRAIERACRSLPRFKRILNTIELFIN